LKDRTFISASLVAAIAASLCCILPIVFALAGITIAGAATRFAAWRPYLLAATFALLAAGFYLAYRPMREQCAPDAACARPATRRSGRLLLWLAMALVIALAAFPNYSAPVAEFLLSPRGPHAVLSAPRTASLQHASLVIEGMDCGACAAAIENKLKALPGIAKASVSYNRARAEIDYDPGAASIEQFEKVIQQAGYRAHKAGSTFKAELMKEAQ
jgi:mercuric ion transport protein